MNPHAPWHFALNSLAKRCVSGGALSVLQSLALLAGHANSFFYSPSLEIFRGRVREVWHEIDVACVVDGEFVIGEVKERQFSKKDFEKLADVAEVLEPDRAAMFISLEQWDTTAEAWRQEMKNRLLPLGIIGELYALPNF
jgi:hypothetical protein